MNTRVSSEPRYELRKINHYQQQKNTILLLSHKFEKLSIHDELRKPLLNIERECRSKGNYLPFSSIYILIQRLTWSKEMKPSSLDT